MSADNNEIQSLRKRVHDMADVVQAQVTRGAVMANDVATIVTLVRELKDDHKSFTHDTSTELRAIREQVTKTNGRVDRHDDRLTTMDGEISDLQQHRSGAHAMTRGSDRGDAITLNIPINAKAITALILAVIGLIAAAWKAGAL